MIKLTKLLEELKSHKYEYGCVMLYFDFPEIKQIHDKIADEDLYEEEEDKTFGLQKESHVTLLYGLHEEVTLQEVERVLDEFTFSTCKIYNPSLFKNGKYDVLKFDVKGENLGKCNEALKKFPHTTNFPNYHPHLTIGYLNLGQGNKYVKMFKDLEFELVPQYAVYSQADGTKTKIKVAVD